MKGLEPPRRKAQDPKSCAATITPHPRLPIQNGSAKIHLFIASTVFMHTTKYKNGCLFTQIQQF